MNGPFRETCENFAMSPSVADLRINYTRATFDESDALRDPISQFRQWFEQAVESQLHEPNAMVLATVDSQGRPDARVVLLKGFDERGFVFFTNYRSAKGQQLARTPEAALVFLWGELERQVRIEGSVEKISSEESDGYFDSRPEGSKIGAWASNQSEPIASRQDLEAQLAAFKAKYGEGPVPRPEYWGGFRVRPRTLEFWQGRPNRLHDRLRYARSGEGTWAIARLQP